MHRSFHHVPALLQTPVTEGTACDTKSETRKSVHCPRCADQDTRSLGLAGSVLEWFACRQCHYVWSSGTPQVLDAEPIAHLIRGRVLIVDDDTTLLRALALALSDYEPMTAQSASEALLLVQHGNPELLITDYLMPNISGAELISHVRARQPHMKVIMLTGHGAFLEDERRLKDVRHLEKPCGIQRLRDAVVHMIGEPLVADTSQVVGIQHTA